MQMTHAVGCVPAAPPLIMHFSGTFQIAIDKLTIQADEADVNTLTGDTELRGNVTLTHSKG
jgi:lipopolysaccharide assembly outer membrane protein LptD (OstA)